MKKEEPRKTFWSAAVGCGGQREMKKGWFKKEKEACKSSTGLVYSKPTCYICNKLLKIGDFIDGFHPYHDEYSRCKEHKDTDLDAIVLFNQICDLLTKSKIPHSTENEMQTYIQGLFDAKGILYVREHRFSDKDRVDFFIVNKGIAIECKIGSTATNMFAQVKRYLSYDSVKKLILVTSKHMGLPDTYEGKELKVIKVGLGWL